MSRLALLILNPLNARVGACGPLQRPLATMTGFTVRL